MGGRVRHPTWEVAKLSQGCTSRAVFFLNGFVGLEFARPHVDCFDRFASRQTATRPFWAELLHSAPLRHSVNPNQLPKAINQQTNKLTSQQSEQSVRVYCLGAFISQSLITIRPSDHPTNPSPLRHTRVSLSYSPYRAPPLTFEVNNLKLDTLYNTLLYTHLFCFTWFVCFL